MFYLTIIQNGGQPGQAVATYTYEKIDDALAAFHSELAYRGNGREKTTCALLDVEGFTICRESWTKEAPPTEDGGEN